MINKINKYGTIAIASLMILISCATFAISEESTQKDDTLDYTHTVMLEMGSASWCPSCPFANQFWYSTYTSGSYDFEYCTMVIDHNSVGNAYMQNHYNLYWVPSSYIDGFYKDESVTDLNEAGNRAVYDIDAEITKCIWLDPAEIYIEVEITNNEASPYDGSIKVYVVEKVSTIWNDNSGNPYNHAFLDFAITEDVSISSGSTHTTSTTWDGSSLYPGLELDNCQVILAVNNDEPHQDYSDDTCDTDCAPFTAYYVDETTAADPIENALPAASYGYSPEYPSELESVLFTDTSTDLDGTIVSWDWDFGDGNTSTFQNPTHSFGSEGYYTVTLTVEDNSGATDTVSHEIVVNNMDVLAIQTVSDRGFPIRHSADGDWGAAQSFSVDGGGTIQNVDIRLRKFGNPEFNLTVELREDSPTGTLIDTIVFPVLEIASSWQWLKIDFADYYLADGTEGFIVIPPAPSGITTSFGYEWRYAFGNQYDDGAFWFTRDSGNWWRDLPSTYEYAFGVFGILP